MLGLNCCMVYTTFYTSCDIQDKMQHACIGSFNLTIDTNENVSSKLKHVRFHAYEYIMHDRFWAFVHVLYRYLCICACWEEEIESVIIWIWRNIIIIRSVARLLVPCPTLRLDTELKPLRQSTPVLTSLSQDCLALGTRFEPLCDREMSLLSPQFDRRSPTYVRGLLPSDRQFELSSDVWLCDSTASRCWGRPSSLTWGQDFLCSGRRHLRRSGTERSTIG